MMTSAPALRALAVTSLIRATTWSPSNAGGLPSNKPFWTSITRTALFALSSSSLWSMQRLRPALANGRHNFRHSFCLRLRAEAALSVDANADGAGLQIAWADNQHGVNLR